ncbi:MAG: PP2C family protein-serine/threonine phosphatase [Spirochaetota bacterium]
MRETILIVDDNPDMAFLIRRGFRDEEYRILEAHDGMQALELMRRDPPDLVLLDLKMPGTYGLAVLEEIRNDPALAGVPVIVLTVVDDVQEKIAALHKGANDFVLKPPLTEELKARVRTHLRLRRATEELRSYSRRLEEIVARNTEDLRAYATRLEEMVEDKVGMIRRQHRELMENLQSAHKVQRALLPSGCPDLPGITCFVRYHPCMPVGGDFYDLFRIDPETLGIFIADVSGHGVPSALMTVFLKQELTDSARAAGEGACSPVCRPRETLARLNRTFFSLNLGEHISYVTLVYCTLHLPTRRLACSLAGHHALPCIRRRDGSVEVLRMEGYPIGWFEQVTDYGQVTTSLDEGDTLYLYTDGLLDLLGEDAAAGAGVKAPGVDGGGGRAASPGEEPPTSPRGTVLPPGTGYLGPVVRFLGGEEVERRFDLLYRERTGRSPLRDDVTLLGVRMLGGGPGGG